MTVKNERLNSNIHKELSYIIANEVNNNRQKIFEYQTNIISYLIVKFSQNVHFL